MFMSSGSFAIAPRFEPPSGAVSTCQVKMRWEEHAAPYQQSRASTHNRSSGAPGAIHIPQQSSRCYPSGGNDDLNSGGNMLEGFLPGMLRSQVAHLHSRSCGCSTFPEQMIAEVPQLLVLRFVFLWWDIRRGFGLWRCVLARLCS